MTKTVEVFNPDLQGRTKSADDWNWRSVKLLNRRVFVGSHKETKEKWLIFKRLGVGDEPKIVTTHVVLSRDISDDLFLCLLDHMLEEGNPRLKANVKSAFSG